LIPIAGRTPPKNKARTRLRESEKPGDADARRADFDFNKKSDCELARGRAGNSDSETWRARFRALAQRCERLCDWPIKIVGSRRDPVREE
jgi:hypothetical protein